MVIPSTLTLSPCIASLLSLQQYLKLHIHCPLSTHLSSLPSGVHSTRSRTSLSCSLLHPQSLVHARCIIRPNKYGRGTFMSQCIHPTEKRPKVKQEVALKDRWNSSSITESMAQLRLPPPGFSGKRANDFPS